MIDAQFKTGWWATACEIIACLIEETTLAEAVNRLTVAWRFLDLVAHSDPSENADELLCRVGNTNLFAFSDIGL